MTKFNAVINSKGKIDSLVISFSDQNLHKEITYMYRREEDVSKCYSVVNNNDEIDHLETLLILEMFERLTKKVPYDIEKDELIIFDLVSPTINEYIVEAGDMVNGIEILNKKEVNGIAFFCYVSSVDISDNSVLIIETN